VREIISQEGFEAAEAISKKEDKSGSSQARKNRFSNLKEKKDLNANHTKANNGFFHFSRA